MKAITSLLVLYLLILSTASAQQTPLPGSSIPQFVDPLPSLPVVDGTQPVELHMREFPAQVLSTGTLTPGAAPSTWVWGYIVGPDAPGSPPSTYLGPVIVARRGIPTEVRYVNDLGTVAGSNLLAFTQSTDQTIHWADPLNSGANACAEQAMMNDSTVPPGPPCNQHYSGSIPATVHLHGAEDPAVIDGGPDSWFTSDGLKGPSFYSRDGSIATNYAIYRYPNGQESEPLWFHDHTLGITRLNVYAGLAGMYLLTDPPNDPANLPPAIPLIIQDRMFDTSGQLFFPGGPGSSPTPEHPFWVPEFFGDTVVVNGRTWPFFEVEPRRYRFVILNASNARAYKMHLAKHSGAGRIPAIWQIATDGGYLDRPVRIARSANKNGVQELFLMPGERAEVIIDFSSLKPGARLLLRNTANAPYPGGTKPDATTLGRILQFRVVPLSSADTTFNPARSAAVNKAPLVRLTNPVRGSLAQGTSIAKTRQLTLNEMMGSPVTVNGVDYPQDSLGILLNNTRWNGQSPRTYGDFSPVSTPPVTNLYSELPVEGTTEVWEIVNLTQDAHPIHLHLVEYQILNRQKFQIKKYNAAYSRAFPGKKYIPSFGPPLDYAAARNPLSGGKDGGNPDVSPYLNRTVEPPAKNEAGWKDTVVAYPGMVTRLAVRFGRTDLPVTTPAEQLSYAFEPNSNGVGYVWHCHILDHEDNEMMRPFALQPRSVQRSYVLGVDY